MNALKGSLYQELVAYTGIGGQSLSPVDFSHLSNVVLGLLEQATTKHLLMRLDRVDLNQKHRFDSCFFVPEGQIAYSGWETCQLEIDSPLINEQFIIVNDNSLPIALVARYDGQCYQTVLTIDLKLIEHLRATLAQYDDKLNAPLIISERGFESAGQLVALLHAKYPAIGASLWLNNVLAESTLHLTALQEALQAVWVRWNEQSCGSLPPLLENLPTDGYYHLQRIETAKGDIFEAAGLLRDSNFITRSSVCAGLLSVIPLRQERLLPTAPKRKTKQKRSQENRFALSRAFNESELNLDIFNYISREIASLRDHVLNTFYRHAPQLGLQHAIEDFANRSGDLQLLISEAIYSNEINHENKSFELIDLVSLVNSLIITYAGEAERQGISLSVQLPEQLPLIHGDAEAINRALVLMLEHALEKTPLNGQIRLGIVQEKSSVKLFVADTGHLLTKQALANKLMPQLSQKGQLYGLGLALLKPITAAHGGRLNSKRVGKFNVLELCLPIHHPMQQLVKPLIAQMQYVTAN